MSLAVATISRPFAISSSKVSDASRARRSSTIVSSADGKGAFPGFLKKKIDDGKKRFEEGQKVLSAVASEFEDAHKKNIEKLDEIAKQDVEFAKWILSGSDADLAETHKKNIEILDELSKGDVEFVKKTFAKSDAAEKPAAFEPIDVQFEDVE